MLLMHHGISTGHHSISNFISCLQAAGIGWSSPLLRHQVLLRYLVTEAHAMGLEVIDRCNLTVLQEPGQEDLVSFLAQHKVQHHPEKAL